MNFQLAAIVGGVTLVVSFLMGLIGGVPFFDIVIRALFWGLAGFGACLGIEALLKSLVPDLLVPPGGVAPEPEPIPQAAPEADRVVDIVVEDEAPLPRYRAEEALVAEAADAGDAEPVRSPEPVAPEAAEAEGEMPEIGSFLDAFKPSAPGDAGEAGATPEVGDYAPTPAEAPRSHTGEAVIDGEAQDPAILAKAVQTVMKRDGQGT